MQRTSSERSSVAADSGDGFGSRRGATGAPLSCARTPGAGAGRGRHPRPDEYGLQLQCGGDALHEFFTNGAGRHLCEDGAQCSDELVLVFGAAEVRAIEVLLDVEALERVRAGDERADGFSALAAEQISGVAAGGQRRDEQSQARWSGDLCGPQDRLGAGVVAVKHEHDRRCESLERGDLLVGDQLDAPPLRLPGRANNRLVTNERTGG